MSMELTQKIKSDFKDEFPEIYLKRVNRSYLVCKRAFDVFFALLLLPFLIPLMILIILLIKFDSPGPIFYNHMRVGKNENLFNCFKFRTMVMDADQLKKDLAHLNEMQGPVFKMKQDPRTTRMGKFLRKSSLDELPQVFNVLLGSMSFVGPRPPLPEEVSKYSSWEKQRLLVTPGLTCVWQVSGRNNIDSFEDWVRMDLEYINNASLIYDILLIIKTIPVVLFRKGAY